MSRFLCFKYKLCIYNKEFIILISIGYGYLTILFLFLISFGSSIYLVREKNDDSSVATGVKNGVALFLELVCVYVIPGMTRIRGPWKAIASFPNWTPLHFKGCECLLYS